MKAKTSNVLYPAVAQFVLKMYGEDQAMRWANASDASVWDDQMDKRHADQLQPIIVGIGWLTVSKVGKPASQAAALLVRHFDHNTDLQKMCLDLMKASPRGEVDLSDVAHLEDRICVNLRKPQIYGTQFHEVKGKDVPRPICNPTRVDERRKMMGLPTLAQGVIDLRQKYAGNWNR